MNFTNTPDLAFNGAMEIVFMETGGESGGSHGGTASGGKGPALTTGEVRRSGNRRSGLADDAPAVLPAALLNFLEHIRHC